MDFVDNVIDRSSGTIRGRAQFANADGLFTPGMFARVRVPGSPAYPALLIPDAAIGSEQVRKFVLVVDGESVARQRYVTLGQVVDGLRVIKEGLAADDRVIVNGLMRARPGVKVKAQEQEAPRRLRRDHAVRRDADLALLHRPADLRGRHLDRIRDPGRGGVRASADRAVSRDRAADHQRDRPISGRERRSRRFDRGRADRGADQRRREHALPVLELAPPTDASTISVTFDLGTNLDIAQVQVQNRVSVAQPRLPADVRNIGVTVNKSSPDLMMVVHLYSPDKSRDTLFISNFATLEIKDQLTRVDGVGSITVFGSRDYAMRIWLDPDRLQSLGLTAQRRDARRCRGRTSRSPRACSTSRRSSSPGAFQIAVKTLGRLVDPEEFGNITVKRTPTRRSCGSRTSPGSSSPRWTIRRTPISICDPAVALAVFQRPGSNALATAKVIRTDHGGARRSAFRPASSTRSSTTRRSSSSSRSTRCVETILRSRSLLVVLVIVLFLQTWRAAVIPLVAIPVSLIGTFFFMALFGFTLNNLSLFGLVLAVGIVVDDAIVVVENVERNIAAGLGAARGRDQEHGRGRLRADRDRARAVCGVRAVRLHHRHFRTVLPAVRAHHRGRDRRSR